MAVYKSPSSIPSHCSHIHTKIADNGAIRPSLVACRATPQKWTIQEATSELSKPRQIILNGQSFKTDLQDEFSMEYEQKLKDVREILKSEELENRIESLMLVDAIQRLDVDYHFQEEIEAVLRRHYMEATTSFDGYPLHDLSLFFRLLREHGFSISADIFNKFKGTDGVFEGKLKQDIRGLMELYEAAQLVTEGEDILDEAAKFSGQIVSGRLKHPYHRSIARFTAKKYIRDFQGINGWRKKLKELAKMNISMAQTVNKQELAKISKWWKDLGLAQELKQARNQPLKWYTWSMASLSDPSMSEQRLELTKSITFIYIIDDIFDLYGTPEELTVFTRAVHMWDYSVVQMLPKPMKMCYKALLDTTNDIGCKIYKKHGYNPIDSLKSAWGSLCDAFLVEAKWFASGHLPTSHEYLENGKLSSGVHVVLVHLFFLLGVNRKTGGAVQLDDIAEVISSVATILRLWDDFGSAKDEQQDGNDGSYIECYMKENPGSTIETVRERVIDMISSEWKHLNKECFCLNKNSSSSSFTKASLNLARMVPLMYSYDDDHQLPILEEFINSTLFDDTVLVHRP
ncbi:(3S,6E)-nerolidol synthase 1-like isoform X1 [Olea europaea var. sylvestris]|uniref:(3S,6E)-nerolidol synthase 1-like isoform X1 n=1 Tax=Olea europaea var. sylvestris TaxID=158386 RepID=UPI000C1D52EB|nr:(3S,6E)-nerolidol synthase 1-like isoform X1 [Olea europaea var. sylvestris]